MIKVRTLVLSAVAFAVTAAGQSLELKSPDGNLSLGLKLDGGKLCWSLADRKGILVLPSRLGLVFSGFKKRGGPANDMLGALAVVDKSMRSEDVAWETRLYRRGSVRSRYNELALTLEEMEFPHRKVGYVFRAYDEGVAFRYVIPAQDGVLGAEILSELTEWRFPGMCEGWFTSYKSEYNGNEEPFLRRRMADIDPREFVGMPATVEVAGRWVALCEAALVNWAGIYFKTPGIRRIPDESVFEAHLTTLPKTDPATPGVAVICELPAESPWRVVIVGDTQLDLLRKNDIILDLNPPPDRELDFGWVKPGPSSWDWWVESNNSLSTELTLRMVDFAAEMGWPYHTIDGGWYGFARRPNHGPGVRLEPRKGFDLKKIIEHATAKGVGIWVWIHWQEIQDTGIEETFARLSRWGVKGVKTDFLNRQDQWMVCWYERLCRTAAKHHIMVNFHGAHRPTGTERTWPNMMTREGVLGNEMNIFSKSTGATPVHCATLPFTRFLLGPGDFTPGGFGNVYSRNFIPQVDKGHRYGDETDRCPHWAEEMGTRAHALALCVAFDSPLMTLCDWPERYRGSPGVEALQRLPTTWKATMPVAGKCGEYYAVVRETHDGRFYFAAFTVSRRTIELNLDFLGEGTWTMSVFSDDPKRTPTDAKAIAVSRRAVNRHDSISFELGEEGGAVAIFDSISE